MYAIKRGTLVFNRNTYSLLMNLVAETCIAVVKGENYIFYHVIIYPVNISGILTSFTTEKCFKKVAANANATIYFLNDNQIT